MKFFYLGLQRCGTKSFGDFFLKNGLRVFSWRDIDRLKIQDLWFEGRWLDILKSGIFEDYDVFEDGPFMDPVFAKFLSQCIPDSRFAYFHRPASDWYKSMVTHSFGATLGDLRQHCYIYDRLEDLHFLQREIGKDLKKLNLIGMKAHYEGVYERHHHQVLEKFSNIEDTRFYCDDLYSEDKFDRMCKKFEISLPDQSDQLSHKTRRTFVGVVSDHDYLF